MKRFVLDASVSLAWFLDNPEPALALRVRDLLEGEWVAIVPALWHWEMANGLAVAERKRMLTAVSVDRCASVLQQLLSQKIETSTQAVPLQLALGTARKRVLSSYDAVYLETARLESLPLATLDKALRAAAVKAGVELIR